MRKREFLKELRKRLERINYRDTEDVMEYYDELIEDTIDRTGKREEEVIFDLGPICDIVLRLNPNEKSVEDTGKIYYDEVETYENHSRKERHRYHEERHESRRYDEPVEYREKPKKKSHWLGILLVVLTFPIWLTILIGLIALIIGIVAASFGIGIAGIGYISYGIAHFGVNFANGLFQLGIGVVCVGLTLVLAPIVIKIVAFLVKLVARTIRSLCGDKKRRRRVVYED